MKIVTFLAFVYHAIPSVVSAFSRTTPVKIPSFFTPSSRYPLKSSTPPTQHHPHLHRPNPQLQLSPIELAEIAPPLNSPEIDLSVIALVTGQENYGLAIVALGEAVWSFSQAPSLSHSKVLVPAILAGVLLVGVSGPMVMNASDPAAIRLGLEIATGVSVMLGASYVARMAAPYSPSSKEIAFLGLLVAIAGFFSFSQNLLVDGFVQLPTVNLPTVSLPSLPGLPSLPSLSLPSLPSLPSIELPSVELPTIELPSVELPTIELPSVDLPATELPSVNLPTTELPSADL